jgi:uncharacterized protein
MTGDVFDLPAQFGGLSLADAGAMLADQRTPPVERWDPPDRGDSQIEIRADGSWWHQGGEIRRPALVRLFASILRREIDGSYWLVTPHEKQHVRVADLPFRAVEVLSEGKGKARQLLFRLDSGELVPADRDHPLSFNVDGGEPRPALHVRGMIGNGLEARLTRSLYYELVELALAEGSDPPSLWSGGVQFVLTP